jgi:1-acyl-sn-glycerol-3-phosphate acyltransferase
MSTARREPIYTTAILVGRALFGGILQVRRSASGLDNLPDCGGAVLAITHFGYMDFALTEWMVWGKNRRRIRFLAQKAAFDQPGVGWLMRGMRHISVDRKAGAQAYAIAVSALRSGELLGVFPEAGVSASFTVRQLKSGAVRMAAEAGVPIIPIAVWGGHLLKTKSHKARFREAFRAPVTFAVGDPMHVGQDDDFASQTDNLRRTLQGLIDILQQNYPLEGQGRWWQPAHLGGSAPTPEEAATAEARRQRLKSERAT